MVGWAGTSSARIIGRTNKSTEGEFGVLPVSDNGADVTNLILQTSPGSSIKGRLRFDASRDAKTPNPSAIELSPIPVDVDASPSRTCIRRNPSGLDV